MARRFETWADLFLSGAEHRPDEIGFGAVADGSGGDEIPRRMLVDQALRVSRGFGELGLRRGSVVVLHGQPSASWASTFAGVLLAGGMPAPIHTRSTKAEIERVMSTSRADFVVLPSSVAPPDAAVLGNRFGVVTSDAGSGTGPSIPEMLALEPGTPARLDGSDLGVVMQTSGTTGNPKCVAHTHASHLEFLDRWSELTMNDEDRVLSFLPLNHQSGLLLSWLSAYSLGNPYWQLHPFTLDGFWDAVRRYQITWTSLIEPVPTYMLDAAPSPADRDHRLRFVAGSRRPEQVAEMDKRFGIRLLRPYGSTETTLVAMSVNPDRAEVQDLSVDELARCAGPAMRDWSFRIIGEDGAELPTSVAGDLQVKGPSLFSHYLNDAEATAQAFTDDGWFRTGDRAYTNDHGELFFVERVGNTIRRNGESISAAEIESTLLEHPAVKDVVVVAVPDELRGHEIRACVVTVEGVSVSAQDLFEHCMQSLAKFKVPRYIDFWEELPRTSTLKVARGQLDSDPTRWTDRYQ